VKTLQMCAKHFTVNTFVTYLSVRALQAFKVFKPKSENVFPPHIIVPVLFVVKALQMCVKHFTVNTFVTYLSVRALQAFKVFKPKSENVFRTPCYVPRKKCLSVYISASIF
jgi:hypothetical protein